MAIPPRTAGRPAPGMEADYDDSGRPTPRLDSDDDRKTQPDMGTIRR